jgi:hypothetical protein
MDAYLSFGKFDINESPYFKGVMSKFFYIYIFIRSDCNNFLSFNHVSPSPLYFLLMCSGETSVGSDNVVHVTSVCQIHQYVETLYLFCFAIIMC